MVAIKGGQVCYRRAPQLSYSWRMFRIFFDFFRFGGGEKEASEQVAGGGGSFQ